MQILAVAVSLLCGVSLVLSRILTAGLGERLGPIEATVYNQLTGTVVSIVLLLLSGELMAQHFLALRDTNFLMYFGGVIAGVYTILTNIVAPRIPALHLTLLFFAASQITGIILDVFRSGKVPLLQIAGIILVSIGFVVNTLQDKLEKCGNLN